MNSRPPTNRPTRRARLLAMLAAMLLLGLSSCADEQSADLGSANNQSSEVNNTVGVGQSGAQDFGRFRGIIERGAVPTPETLDVVGFFNEHKFELPSADCGDNVCAHGYFGVWSNMLNGANCSLAMLGFNTSLKPDDFDRPPMNLAVAVDVSGSMAGVRLENARAGLSRMVDELDQKDTVTLVAFDTDAELLYTSTPEEDPERSNLRDAINNLQSRGETNIYAGLKLALDDVRSRAANNRQNRVILLSDGLATSGITNRDRIVRLGESYAEEGIGITSIGIGDSFDIELMRRLSETGAGNFYFLEDLGAVLEVFESEVNTFMVPLAEDVRIKFEAEQAYRFRATYGTRIWEGDAGGADVYIPSLFMASRTTINDIEPDGGRRGGGGAILFEVVPTTDQALLAQTEAGAPVGTITFSYQIPNTEQRVEQTIELINPVAPGITPDEGRFESFSIEKAFVALNIYVGLKMALERHVNGAPRSALTILEPLLASARSWETQNNDPDIEADLALVERLINTLRQRGIEAEQIPAPNPWPQGD